MATPEKVPPTLEAVASDSTVAGDNNMMDATAQYEQQPPASTTSNPMSNSNHTKQYLLLEDIVKLISLPPSKENLLKLASNMITTNVQNVASSSSTIHQQQRQHYDRATSATSSLSEHDLNLMIAYLRAAAHQLHVLVMSVDSQQHLALSAASTSGDNSSGGLIEGDTSNIINFDMDIDTCTHAILPVICTCIAQLSDISSSSDDRASIISDTGILESLWYMVEYYDLNAVTVFACEFLQACILCHQYSFAFQRVVQTWPLPKKSQNGVVNRGATICSVEVVLRYYYLRGVVCMGCCSKTTTVSPNDLAIRCFWTCLSIPTTNGANTVSWIAISAYKKLVLLQALSPFGILHTAMIRVKHKGIEDNFNTNDISSTTVIVPSTNVGMSSGVPPIIIPSATNPLSTPTEMPWDLVRYIAQAHPPALVTSSSSSHTATTASQPVYNAETLNRGSTQTEASNSTVSSRNRYTYPHFGVHVYQLLLHTFVAIDRKKFNTILNEYSDLFHADGNYSYVIRLSNALYYRQIYVISRSFASIPMYQLSVEMNSFPIDHIRVLLHKLQENLSWPVKIMKISSLAASEQEEVVIFPSDLPHPTMFANDDESMLVSQLQLNELSQRMQQVSAMMESSSKYKAATTYYDRQQQQQKSTKSNKTASGASSMVMEDSISNY